MKLLNLILTPVKITLAFVVFAALVIIMVPFLFLILWRDE